MNIQLFVVLFVVLLLIIIIYINRYFNTVEGKKGKKGKKGKCSIKSIRKKCKKKKGKKKKKCIRKKKNKCKTKRGHKKEEQWTGVCKNFNRQCNHWASVGECSKSQDYMHIACPASCGLCNNTPINNTPINIYNTACGATKPISEYGTVNWITDMYSGADKTAFENNWTLYIGLDEKWMFDRRTDSFNYQMAHIFYVVFGTNTQQVIEARVNSDDFNKQDATGLVTKYCTFVGRLPGFLVSGLKIINIQGGDDLWGGNADLGALEITTGGGDVYINDGDIYDVIAHELTHVSMDLKHLKSSGWIAAMNQDCMAISSYAGEHPGREDLAETLGPYIAFRRNKLTSDLITGIKKIPARFSYLDSLNLSMDILP
jgi:hypothetical protein